MKTIKKAIETFEEIPECEEECISQKKYYMETDGNVHEIESDYMVIKDSDGNSISKIYLELKYMDEDIFSFAEVNCDEEKLKYRDNYEEGDLDFKIRYGLLRLSRDIKGNIIPFGEKIITPAIYDRICCNNLLTATAYTKEGLTYIDINPDSENFGKQMVPGILKHAVPFDIDYENFAECSVIDDQVGYLPRNVIPKDKLEAKELLTEKQVKALINCQKQADDYYYANKKYSELTGKSYCKK